MKKRVAIGTGLAIALSMSLPLQAQQGVSTDQIVIGSLQDLSGPIAGFGKQLKNGLQMKADEINDAGGIHGRKIKMLVEDSAYDPKKGLLATQKLVQQDKIFAMVGTLGTPVAMASFQPLFDKNIPHLFPLTAAREMYEPLSKLKFSFAAPYFDQLRSGVKWMAKERKAKKFCALYQDDEFGLEVFRGAEQGLKDMQQSFAETTTYKRGATDFSAQTAKMKSADCDVVVLGTIIRETIGAIATAKKMGWEPLFLGSSAAYTDLIHKLGGKAMDGFYATYQTSVPYMDDESKSVRDWSARYKAKFNEEPGLFSAYGYLALDLFAVAAQKVGKDLNTESLANAFETGRFPRDIFGSPEMKFSKSDHLGNKRSRIGQIQDGKWAAVTDYLD